jgi:low affinity Fe/Cu permease
MQNLCKILSLKLLINKKMIKFIILVLLIFVIIGSGNVFDFEAKDDLWILTTNHTELLNSLTNGVIISYEYIADLIAQLQSK